VLVALSVRWTSIQQARSSGVLGLVSELPACVRVVGATTGVALPSRRGWRAKRPSSKLLEGLAVGAAREVQGIGEIHTLGGEGHRRGGLSGCAGSVGGGERAPLRAHFTWMLMDWGFPGAALGSSIFSTPFL
jgi:hypothetical protein